MLRFLAIALLGSSEAYTLIAGGHHAGSRAQVQMQHGANMGAPIAGAMLRNPNFGDNNAERFAKLNSMDPNAQYAPASTGVQPGYYSHGANMAAPAAGSMMRNPNFGDNNAERFAKLNSMDPNAQPAPVSTGVQPGYYSHGANMAATAAGSMMRNPDFGDNNAERYAKLNSMDPNAAPMPSREGVNNQYWSPGFGDNTYARRTTLAGQ